MTDELGQLRDRIAKLEKEVISADARNDHMLRFVQQMAATVLTQRCLEMLFKASGDADAVSRRMLDEIERSTDRFSFEGVEGPLSDLATQELRDTQVRMVLRARFLALDETIDREAYRKDWRIPRNT